MSSNWFATFARNPETARILSDTGYAREFRKLVLRRMFAVIIVGIPLFIQLFFVIASATKLPESGGYKFAGSLVLILGVFRAWFTIRKLGLYKTFPLLLIIFGLLASIVFGSVLIAEDRNPKTLLVTSSIDLSFTLVTAIVYTVQRFRGIL